MHLIFGVLDQRVNRLRLVALDGLLPTVRLGKKSKPEVSREFLNLHLTFIDTDAATCKTRQSIECGGTQRSVLNTNLKKRPARFRFDFVRDRLDSRSTVAVYRSHDVGVCQDAGRSRLRLRGRFPKRLANKFTL